MVHECCTSCSSDAMQSDEVVWQVRLLLCVLDAALQPLTEQPFFCAVRTPRICCLLRTSHCQHAHFGRHKKHKTCMWCPPLISNQEPVRPHVAAGRHRGSAVALGSVAIITHTCAKNSKRADHQPRALQLQGKSPAAELLSQRIQCDGPMQPIVLPPGKLAVCHHP